MLADYRKRFGALTAYATDPRAHDVVERNVQVAVQALIDLADALVARRRWGRPLTAVVACARGSPAGSSSRAGPAPDRM